MREATLQKKPHYPLVVALWFAVAPSAFAITPQDAVAVAVNDLRAVPSGVALSHPGYEATWTREGFEIAARTGPSWSWTLDAVLLGADRVDLSREIAPVADEKRVDYHRGAIVERYVCKLSTIEQQFVIPQRLGPGGGDLLIAGTVRSSGTFEPADGRWLWRDARGAISVGDVTVFDASGRTLAASMTVTGDRIEIAVDGASLADAVYPVTVDPEIGPNDFRISDMGTEGNSSHSAGNASVAYNSENEEFLVVWTGYEGTEVEVWGQRVSAVNGDPIGGDFKISDMGGAPGFEYEGRNPDVAYNALLNDYLVVWQGDDNAAPLIDGDNEIFGEILDAETGGTLVDDFRISFMGGDGQTDSTADRPSVAWDSVNDRYLVVWAGYDADINEFETEVWGRVLSNVGVSISSDDTRLSNVGADADTTRAAQNPDVAFESTSERYLVVWSGDHAADNAYDIYGQRVDWEGAEVGSNFRISDLGNSDSDSLFQGEAPAIAANSAGGFLVVWFGDDDSPGSGQLEIWGQLVTSAGAESGTNDFRISDTGPPGDNNFGARNPAVDYSPAAGEYIVAWEGDDSTDEEIEIWMRRVSSAGAVSGAEDIRVSDAGPDASPSYFALQPALAFGGQIALITWHGDDDVSPLVDDEHEVFGQLYAIGAPVPNPVLDDFFTEQEKIEITQEDLDHVNENNEPAPINTKNSHEHDPDPDIFTGERNLRVSSIDVSGGPVSIEVAGGDVAWNRPGTSTGSFYVWWDGDNDNDNFSVTGTPYDLTGGGEYDRFRINVTSSSSTSLELRLFVWTDGSNFSHKTFTLPASGPREILFTEFTANNAGADFDAARVVYLTTFLPSGTWSAQLSSISLASEVQPPSGDTTTIDASPGSIAADGASTAEVTVQARDASDAAIPSGGATVLLSTTLGSLGSVTDNADGTYTATLTSETTLGTATISGSIDGDPITDTAEVELTPGPASVAFSTISASPTSIVADGSATSDILVVLRDENGLSLAEGGDDVALDATSGSLSEVTDNGDGTYSATLTAPVTTGVGIVTGTIAAVAIEDDASVIFTVGPAATLLVEAPATAIGGTAFDVTVTAKDAQGRTATSYIGTVAFSSTATSATLPSNYTFTNGDDGVHTFSVTLSSVGNRVVTVTDTVTPSITGNDTVAVKGNTTTALASSANPSLVGQSVTFTATVTSAIAGTVTGNVTFKDGAETLGTSPVSGGAATYTTTALSSGSHSITAEYAGSSNFNGSTSNTVGQTVNLTAFGAPALVVATATSTSQVSVIWTAVDDASSYEVWRSSLGAAFAPATTTSATSFTDVGRSADTTYVYQVRAIGLPGTSGFSDPDAATTTVFTNVSLIDVSVKALHLTEVRTAVAAMRTAAGLPAASFTDDLTAESTVIKRIHLIELREALDEARDTLGLPALGYTNSTITPESTQIKAVHVEELRAGTQ